jgi:uncharacterized protein (TIGR02452 family)
MWDAAEWLAVFHAASTEGDRSVLHSLRADVFQDTIRIVGDRCYEVDGQTIHLDSNGEYDALHRSTAFYRSADDLEVPGELRNRFTTSIRVAGTDCLVEAQRLGEAGPIPAVLNMASRRNPGGGVLGGSGAQEENLFRRTNLLWSLYQFAPYADQYGVPPSPDGEQYPIPRQSGGIYSPPAWVFRSSESTGYAYLPEPYRAAFLTVPAIANPETTTVDGVTGLTERMAEATRPKIRAILRIAANHGHADLVLSAFGCGAFRNPPRHMAELFRDTLGEDEFGGVFRAVVFAILDDHNAVRPDSRSGNYAPFKEVLDPG